MIFRRFALIAGALLLASAVQAQQAVTVGSCSTRSNRVGDGAPLSVLQNGDLCTAGAGTGSVAPQSTTIRAAGTNRSATVGTSATTLMPANASRQGWKIKNDTTGDIWISFDGTASAAAGGGNLKIPAGGYLSSEPGFIETGPMSAIGSAAGLAITAREH